MDRLLVIVLIISSLMLYGLFLERTPVHLNQDELGFSLNAYSIIKTGFDENGRYLPFYFWHLGVMWSTPIIVYLTALLLAFLPFSETTVRLASVLVGLLDIILLYILAKKLFNSHWYGLVAGVLLALTPAHFIHSRVLLDNIFIVPFVIGWLLFLQQFLDKKQKWALLLAGFILGVGMHSYHAAKVMMPIYLIITFITIIPEVKARKQLILLPVIGFILPLLSLIPWLVQYPDTFIDQVKYTRLYDAKLGSFLGIATLLTGESIIRRLSIFIAYFDPFFLFFKGDASLIHSTWKIGVFLLSFMLFLPMGIAGIIKSKVNRFLMLLIAGFFTAPIAAALVGDHFRISRALVILPFAVLLATYGIKYIFSQKLWLVRLLAVGLVALIPVQFSFFYYDYLKDYRIRSYNWFKYNIPGVLESIIDLNRQSSVSAIFLDNRIEFIDRYWKFYLIKHNQEDLLARTYYFDTRDVQPELLPSNSLLVYHFDHISGQYEYVGPFKKVKTIYEPDGTSRFYIFRN